MPPTERTSLVDPLLGPSTELLNYDSQNNRNDGDNVSEKNSGASSPAAPLPTSKESYKKDVTYDGDDHLGVILQMNGSVWPDVGPFCIASVVWTYFVILLRNHNIVNLTITSNNGHSFMSLLVSFLVVTRASITYARFMEARQYLADIFRASREIVHYTCLLTNLNKDDKSVQWRQDVAYRTIIALRVAIAAVEFRSHGVNAWETLGEEDHEVTELFLPSEEEHADCGENENLRENHRYRGQPSGGTGTGSSSARDLSGLRELGESSRRYKPKTQHNKHLQGLRHGPRSLMDENLRAPIVWAYNIREKLMEHRKSDILKTRPPHVNEDLKWFALSSDWMEAFHGLKILLTTPFPFPLVQMTRTFLFVWVFSLPLVLVADNDNTVEVLVLMFFITYGFLGVEYVSMELDDPYGKDPNDFPGKRWAELVYEDIYVCIYKSDGYKSAMELRSRIKERIGRGDALDNFHSDMQDSQLRFFGTHELNDTPTANISRDREGFEV